MSATKRSLGPKRIRHNPKQPSVKEPSVSVENPTIKSHCLSPDLSNTCRLQIVKCDGTHSFTYPQQPKPTKSYQWILSQSPYEPVFKGLGVPRVPANPMQERGLAGLPVHQTRVNGDQWIRYDPILVRNPRAGGFPIEWTDLTEVGPVLRDYVTRARIDNPVTGWGFIIRFADSGNGAHDISTPFLPSLFGAIDATVDLITEVEEKYDDSTILEIILKTNHGPNSFRGSDSPASESADWKLVTNNSTKNCAITAILIGWYHHHKKLVTYKGVQFPVLLAPNQARNNFTMNFIRSKVKPYYKNLGQPMPVGATRQELDVLGKLRGCHIFEHNSCMAKIAEYGDPNGIPVHLHLARGHCELMLRPNILSEEEISSLQVVERPPPNVLPIDKPSRTQGPIMAADIEAYSRKDHQPWAIGSEILHTRKVGTGLDERTVFNRVAYIPGVYPTPSNPKAGPDPSKYLYGTDCLSQWTEYLNTFQPVYNRPRFFDTLPKKWVKALNVKNGVPTNTWEARKYNTCYVYFHNGKRYDFYLLMNHLIQQNLLTIEKGSVIADGSRMITFTAVNQHGYRFTFRDSCLLCPGTLSGLSKDFDCEHQKLSETVDFETLNQIFDTRGFTNETIDYIRKTYPVEKYLLHDCLSLLEIVEKLAKFSKDLGVDFTHRMTQTNLAKTVYRTSFMDHDIAQLSNDQDAFIGDSILGGDCGPSFMGQYEFPTYFFDITSQYPAVCIPNPLLGHNGLLPCRPIGNPVDLTVSLRTVEDFHRHFPLTKNGKTLGYFLKVRATSTPHAFYYRQSFHMRKQEVKGVKKNMKPLLVHPALLTRYHEEILYGLSTGLYHYELLQYQTYETDPIFSRYMTHFTTLKAQAKEAGNSALAQFYKILVNSLTGAIAMNPTGRIGSQLMTTDQLSDLQYIASQGKLVDYYPHTDTPYVSVTLQQDLKKTFFNRAVYSAITAKGRIAKDRFERKVLKNGGFTIYGDTDSTLVTLDCSTLPDFHAEFSEPGKVGGWLNEMYQPGTPQSQSYPYTHTLIGGSKSYYLSNPELSDPKNPKKPGPSYSIKNPKCAQKGFRGTPTQKGFEQFLETMSLTEPNESFQFRGGYEVVANDFKLCTTIIQGKTFTFQATKGFHDISGWVLPYELTDTLDNPTPRPGPPPPCPPHFVVPASHTTDPTDFDKMDVSVTVQSENQLTYEAVSRVRHLISSLHLSPPPPGTLRADLWSDYHDQYPNQKAYTAILPVVNSVAKAIFLTLPYRKRIAEFDDLWVYLERPPLPEITPSQLTEWLQTNIPKHHTCSELFSTLSVEVQLTNQILDSVRSQVPSCDDHDDQPWKI